MYYFKTAEVCRRMYVALLQTAGVEIEATDKGRLTRGPETDNEEQHRFTYYIYEQTSMYIDDGYYKTCMRTRMLL